MSELTSALSDDERLKTCTVCLCETDEIFEECKECKNRFHGPCWQSWMTVSSTCPVCRTIAKGQTPVASPPENTVITQVPWLFVGGVMASLFLMFGSMIAFCFLYLFYEREVFLICAVGEIIVFVILAWCVSIKTETEVEIEGQNRQSPENETTRPRSRMWMTRIRFYRPPFQLSDPSRTSVSTTATETAVVDISNAAV